LGRWVEAVAFSVGNEVERRQLQMVLQTEALEALDLKVATLKMRPREVKALNTNFDMTYTCVKIPRITMLLADPQFLLILWMPFYFTDGEAEIVM